MPFGFDNFHQDKFNPVAGYKCEDAVMSLLSLEDEMTKAIKKDDWNAYQEFLDYIIYFSHSRREKLEDEDKDD